MNIKKYEGGSMAEVLAQVKGDLGTEAVILHTRTFKRGGLMGMGAKDVVEITAGMNINIAGGRRQNRDANRPAAAPRPEAKARAAAFESRHVVKKTYAAANVVPSNGNGGQSSSNTNANAATALMAEEQFGSTREMAAAVLKTPVFELRSEISALRTMVESLLQRSQPYASGTAMPEQLSKAYTSLLQQQVADEIALRLVDDVKRELSAEQLSNAAAVRDQLMQRLERLVPAAPLPTAARPDSGKGCRSVCLIGPTGVGKTTTIAKLAAAFKLRQKQNVGLITIDTYRIAAVDQLRTYANIIGVPLKVVLTPADLVGALKEFSHCDTVLIDTTGRSQRDQLKLNELAGFVHAAKPTEVHLVLASTCTQRAMEAALEKFSAVRVDHIIFTKLDEAVSFGVLLNVAYKASKALSYLTTGQDVPDHIEVGQPRRLARLIMGEAV